MEKKNQKKEPHANQSQKEDSAKSDSHKSDVKAVKDQNEAPKDSDHKRDNAANAKKNSGHY